MKNHFNKFSRSSFYSMRRIRVIRRSQTTEITTILVRSLVCSKIDYCNTLLTGLPVSTTNCLDDVHHAAARHKYDNIIPVLRDELHWLPVRQRIECKLFNCIQKSPRNRARLHCFHVCAGLVFHVAITAALSRNWHARPNNEFEKRAFAYADKSAWNTLPIAVKAFPTICAFMQALKIDPLNRKLTLATFMYISLIHG